MNYFRCVWITFRWLLQSMIDVLYYYYYFYIIFIQESIYIFRHLALVEILEIEDGILDFKLLNVVIFLFLKATWLFNHLTISQSSRTFYVCVPVEENLFTVVVDLLYPPVLLPVQEIFLLKQILLHQGTCPINRSHSTGGGKVSQPPR